MPHECTNCGRRFENGSKQMLSGCPDCGGNKFQFQPAGRESSTAADATSAAESDSADPAPSEDTRPASDAPDATPSSADVGETIVDKEVAESATDAEVVNDAKVPNDAAESPIDAAEGPTDAADSTEHDPDQTTFDDEFWDAEVEDEVGDEDRAQSDARSSAVTTDEINEARRKMAETEAEQLADVDDSSSGSPTPGSGGRGTPQGPPTETPSGPETEEFDISGAVGPDEGDPVEKHPVAGSAPESEAPATDENNDLKALRDELNDQFESIKITAPGQYELNLMELYDREEYIISLQEDGRYVIEMADDYGIDDG